MLFFSFFFFLFFFYIFLSFSIGFIENWTLLFILFFYTGLSWFQKNIMICGWCSVLWLPTFSIILLNKKWYNILLNKKWFKKRINWGGESIVLSSHVTVHWNNNMFFFSFSFSFFNIGFIESWTLLFILFFYTWLSWFQKKHSNIWLILSFMIIYVFYYIIKLKMIKHIVKKNSFKKWLIEEGKLLSSPHMLLFIGTITCFFSFSFCFCFCFCLFISFIYFIIYIFSYWIY
jgi:hypothetical protein